MYIDSNFNDYTNLVELHDNYAILSKKTKIQGSSGDPKTIDVVYNYFIPSLTLPTSYTSEETFVFTDYTEYLSSNLEDRGDFPQIFICGFIIIFMLIFIINQLTKLVRKYGIFSG